ncbi:hypothetical protein DQ239_01535 [Blastococcus sp. TF02-09]|uniref:putative bifunctional diguanylate cyclase/phosphodiesterase n=1 Tax=Blastococcus sp. TF02-09 TaxID=2250576 RepID=UPI000DE9ACFA|nr:EAL domain-containing protein [Blastococcus sp. TF02-9]RBY81317.1 hypothetical protein DQ239_01535 [Blastococcus sp. TF02-9]
MTLDTATPTLRSGIYEALFVHAPDGMLIASVDGRVLAANARACELLGRTEQELVELGLPGIVGGSDGRWSEVLGIRDRTNAFRGVVPVVHGDGITFSAEVTTGTFLDGRESRAYVCLRDVGAAEDATAERAEATARSAEDVVDALESVSDMYIGVDADWRMTYINAKAEARLGVAREDVVGRDIWQEFPALVGSDFEPVYRQVARTGRPASLEARYDEADLWCEARVYPLRRGGIAVYFRDISERRAREQERERLLEAERVAREAQRDLARRATRDELTGLLSRAGLRLEVERVLADRPGARLTVVSMDLDRFKLVNHSLGHGAGDRVLGEFARRLAALTGPADAVARYGADEFVVVLVDRSTEEAGRFAEQVLRACREELDVGPRLLVTVSIGLAARDVCAPDPGILLREAGVALHRAKDDGRDRAVWFDEQMHVESVRRVEIENDLRQAVDRDELFVEYQPAFDLRQERIRHVEALVRWRHPLRGLVAPQDFIPVAEETGLVGRIGEQVLDRALAQARRWTHLPDLRVWVNVSPAQLVDRAIPDRIAAALHRAGLPAERLGIEVTESALADGAGAGEVLRQVHDLGVAIAVDDFGTGYSSLARLTEFPVDVVKIDKSFVGDLGTARGEAFVAGIVTLARAIDAHVVAEGVETLPQLTALSALGVDSACGYLLARPAAPEHLPLTLPTEASFRWPVGLHPTVARVPGPTSPQR